MNKINWNSHISRYTFLAVLFAIITTISNYSGFGVVDHIEHLPLIYRALDSNYLINDFFINAGSSSIARFHYTNLLAALARSERNLPFTFLIITLFSNISISLITYYFSRDFFYKSNIAGIYASAVVMSVSTFWLGWQETIYWNSLIPSSLAIPFVLGAIFAVFCGNLVVGMLLTGIASIIHPLLGLETGGLLLITYLAFLIIRNRKITKDDWKVLIPSLLVFSVFSLISLIPQFSQTNIHTDLFIYIMAYFRAPHHYLPSTFGLQQYIYAAAFLCAAFLVFYRGRQTRKESYNLKLLIMVSTIILLCIGGFIFVELIPSRIWGIAQTFRLLYIVKWIGLILVAGTIADINLDKSIKMLLMVGVLHPLSLGVVVITYSLREWFDRIHCWFSRIFDPSLILIITISLLLYLSIPGYSAIFLSFYVLLVVIFREFPRKILYTTLLICIGLIIFFGIFRNNLPYFNQSNLVNRIQNNLVMSIKSGLGSSGDEIAEFARHNTPQDSVFLTPPMWGQFRLLAQRAIVVDFKAFPFSDIEMLNWYHRMEDSYGINSSTIFGNADKFEENYRGINDKTLLNLQEKYKFSYAVLYSQTSTNFEILYQNEEYKVVFVGR